MLESQNMINEYSSQYLEQGYNKYKITSVNPTFVQLEDPSTCQGY